MQNITDRGKRDYPSVAGSRSRKRVRAIPMQTERLPLFGCVPTDLCRDPRCHDLRAFDIAVLATVMSLARLVHGDDLHREAREGGRRAIEQEVGYAEDFKIEWDELHQAHRAGQHREAPERFHVATPYRPRKKPMKMKKAIKLAGRAGYNSTKNDLRERPLPSVSFETTRSLLLRAMKISLATRNRHRLDDALAILSKPMRIGDVRHEPFLAVEWLSADKFVLTVPAGWLDRGLSYQTVPLPLPTKSPLATKLLLWLRVIKPKSEIAENDDINFQKLCELFGIGGTPWVARQAIDCALDVINYVYLPNIDHDSLLQLKKVKLPAIYEIKPIAEGNRISFFAHQAGSFKHDRLLAAREERKRKRRKRTRKRVRVRIGSTEPRPNDETEFQQYLVARGYPSQFVYDDMTPADRQELQTLRREFENNAM